MLHHRLNKREEKPMPFPTKIVTSAVGAAYQNRETLKPIVAPMAQTGKAVLAVLWGTVWKTFLAQIAVGFLWVAAFTFTYLTIHTTALAQSNWTIFTAFVIWAVVPAAVFIREVLRVRKKLIAQRAAMQAAIQQAAVTGQAVIPVDSFDTAEEIEQEFMQQQATQPLQYEQVQHQQ